MSDRWLGRSEGEEIDEYCLLFSHSRKHEYMCLFSDTFLRYHNNLLQKDGSKLRISYFFVIYLPTKHQRALGTRSKLSVRFRSNWNLEMLVFVPSFDT